jgi:hypothetical protein
MYYDWSEFERGMILAGERIEEGAEEGIREAIQELKNDADNVKPRTPHLHGDLRGEYTITEAKITKSGLSISLIFEMPYAERWHEAVGVSVNWSETGVGAKYLESKMSRFHKKYMEIIADTIKRSLN